MIKINLLESVTDRTASVAFVEDKVSSTRTQTFLLALTVMALLVLGVGYDYVSANAQHEAATKEVEKQKRINEQMNAVKTEQAERRSAWPDGWRGAKGGNRVQTRRSAAPAQWRQSAPEGLSRHS